jgi:hypothetical protein
LQNQSGTKNVAIGGSTLYYNYVGSNITVVGFAADVSFTTYLTPLQLVLIHLSMPVTKWHLATPM